MNSQQESEVQEWLERLVSGGSDDERLQAAAALGRLGVRIRGSLRPRGSLTESARGQPQLEESGRITPLLGQAAPQLRCQIALALGEWGGEGAARALASILETDTDQQVRFYCISALRTIGGPVAVRALCVAADTAPANVRDAAISAVRELATGGLIDDTDADISVSMSMGAPVRVRGASPAAGAADTLQRIRTDKSLPLHIRLNAEETLRHFQRG